MMYALRYEDRATDRDWADVLATFPLFAGVGKRQLRKLVRTAAFAELARGEHLVSNRAGNDSLYVVLGGEAKVLHPKPLTIGIGEYFGELGVLGGRPRSLNVVATQELHLMKLPCKPVFELARRHPPVTLTLLKNLGRRLQDVSVAARVT
jgi:CRP-like cAMP-binding protein